MNFMGIDTDGLGGVDEDVLLSPPAAAVRSGTDSDTNLGADTIVDAPAVNSDVAPGSAEAKAAVLAELRALMHVESEQRKHVRGAALLFQEGGAGLLDTLACSRNPHVVRVALAFRRRLTHVGALAGVGGVEAFFAVFAEMFSKVADEELAAEQAAENEVAQPA